MSDPISSVSCRDYSWVDQPFDQEDFRELINRDGRDEVSSVCRDRATVLGAVIWGTDTEVSAACRCARPGSLDALVCDDLTLQNAQNVTATIAQKAIELVLGAKMKSPK